MLYIAYWEINPDYDPSELSEIALDLMKKKTLPCRRY